jgi:hypothetical protein
MVQLDVIPGRPGVTSPESGKMYSGGSPLRSLELPLSCSCRYLPCVDRRVLPPIGKVRFCDYQGRPRSFRADSCLGRRQAAFDAELAGIKASLSWLLQGSFKHMVIHSDSTSATARASHAGSGPGQSMARDIRKSVMALAVISRSAQIEWVKGHSGVPTTRKRAH